MDQLKLQWGPRQCAPVLDKPAGNAEISTKTCDLASLERCLSKLKGLTALLSFQLSWGRSSRDYCRIYYFSVLLLKRIFLSQLNSPSASIQPPNHEKSVEEILSENEKQVLAASPTPPSVSVDTIHTYPALSRTYTMRCAMHVNLHWHVYSWAQLPYEAEFLSSANQIYAEWVLIF